MKKRNKHNKHSNKYEPLIEEELAACDEFPMAGELPADEGFEDKRISDYYTHRRLQKNKMERKVRQSQMWLGRLRIFLRLIVILVLIFIGYKLIKLPQWYLDKNVFNSPKNPYLEIMNNKIVPSYKILTVLRRANIPHVPIYKFETDEIRNNILNLEPVANVYVRRFWFPARLQIIIEEKTPLVSISPSENVQPIAFFTKDGSLIGREYMPLNPSFKTTLVLSYGARGDDYRNWNAEKIILIDNIAKAIKANSFEDIQYIDMRNPHDVYAKIKTANIRLGELDDSIFERIKRIPSILPQVKMLDKPIKYIDLRWKNTNYIKLG